MITSTKGSPNNIIHPTRARNTGFGKENFGRVMMSVRPCRRPSAPLAAQGTVVLLAPGG